MTKTALMPLIVGAILGLSLNFAILDGLSFLRQLGLESIAPIEAIRMNDFKIENDGYYVKLDIKKSRDCKPVNLEWRVQKRNSQYIRQVTFTLVNKPNDILPVLDDWQEGSWWKTTYDLDKGDQLYLVTTHDCTIKEFEAVPVDEGASSNIMRTYGPIEIPTPKNFRTKH